MIELETKLELNGQEAYDLTQSIMDDREYTDYEADGDVIYLTVKDDNYMIVALFYTDSHINWGLYKVTIQTDKVHQTEIESKGIYDRKLRNNIKNRTVSVENERRKSQLTLGFISKQKLESEFKDHLQNLLNDPTNKGYFPALEELLEDVEARMNMD